MQNKAIESVAGYPIYDTTANGSAAGPDELLARYEAGYLVVTGPEDSPLSRLSGSADAIVLTADFVAPAESSAPGNPDYRPDPATERVHGQQVQGVPAIAPPPAQIARRLFARRASGEMASSQVRGSDAAAIASQIDQWRTALQSGPGLDAANAAANSDVNPDPKAWTLLGGRGVKIFGRGWFSPWWDNGGWDWYDTGLSEGTISLYRLNSADAFDYFLVKMLWTVSPKNSRKDFGGIWFYNRDHRLEVGLAAQTAGGMVSGDLINFEPKTVATSQTYDVKFGGDLTAKVGEKPEGGGKVSAEIATKFTIPSVSTNATTNAPRVTWELQHDHGPGLGRGTGHNWPDTTVSGVTAVTWALYRFNFTINNGHAPEMQLSVKLTGTFGSAAEKWWGLKQFLELRYESAAHLLRYAVPTMSYEPVRTPEQPLELARGETAVVQIQAGAPELPLQWRAYEIPKDKTGRPYLVVSPESGSLGNGPLRITAAHDAEPGAFGYLRVNSVPTTSTHSLRKGSLDIPVRIKPA
jgi:hypothetical protein